ncbi:MAG: glycoside hydrolase family 99-like domain-containing protein [Defluviitaleaceae bacterium]|nr:glycoside hydrolase family 99-like domain-containing protein [Defluviitaleaceae bacterium]
MHKIFDRKDLKNFDNIIVYGAGYFGNYILRYLSHYGFDKRKVTVMDVNWKKKSPMFGYVATEPNFMPASNKGINTIVIIAMNRKKYTTTIDNLYAQFLNAGYNTIIGFEAFMGVEVISENQFIVDTPPLLYQDEIDFSDMKPLVKPIAFYLPQFHEIPENSKWWGEGFTEWTNVKKARPKYVGHYQPREPHDDLGYYDLSDVKIIRKQAAMAKRHGIYGWNIYYYWFSGKTLLTKPLDLILENKDIDIHFCLTWCNHSWSKSWVGNKHETLIECEYLEHDPEKFIDDIKKYIDDERYIKVDGKPLVSVYLAQDMVDASDIIERWRNRAREIGIGEIYVNSTIRPFTLAELGLQATFDSEMEFFSWWYAFAAENPKLYQMEKDNEFISSIISRYVDFVRGYKNITSENNNAAYMCVPCGFDNTPRYEKNYRLHSLEFSLNDYYNFVKYATEQTIAQGKEYMFLFAWNEWAESAYLEPDKKTGYAMLNTLSKAINGLPLDYKGI